MNIKNFYYKYFLKYLIYCMNEMFFELFLFVYYCNIVFEKFIFKKIINPKGLYIYCMDYVFFNLFCLCANVTQELKNLFLKNSQIQTEI